MVEALQQTEIDQIREELAGDTDMLKKVRKYAKSEQGRPLTADQRRILGRRAANPIADNVLAKIIATIASRLDLTGFEVANDSDETVKTFLAELWMRNKMPALQYRVAKATLRDGNHAVSLQWRASGRVSLHQERWWDGESGIFVAYDDLGDAAWAVKEWSERAQGNAKKTIKRRTVYYPDKIIRLIKQGSGWVPFSAPNDPTDPDAQPGIIPWTRTDGTPIGLPVVHFAAESGDDNAYGLSVTAGLLGLQDDLNALQYDLSGASAFTGFQMYWMSGVSQSDDELIVGPGRTLKGTGENFRAGVLPPGDMSSLIQVHNQKRQSMAIDTSVPIHLITGGDWPSGDALLRAEMPLVDTATRLARQIGPAWVEVAHRATEIANVSGGAGLDEDRPITAIFAPAERLDEMTRINLDKARVNLYASLNQVQDETLLEKTGLLDAEEIKKLSAERTARAERDQVGVIA